MKYIIFFFVISALFLPFCTFAAPQAALFLNPASGTFLTGSTFDVSVVLDTKGTSVNTIEVELIFPPDKIQVANPSVGRSIIQLWPAPPTFSNSEGRIYFVGGIPSPGIVTSQGVVLTLTFRVVAPGDAEIKFGERTSILANDGRGTDILGQKPSAFYKFQVPPPQGPSISSPSHPDQEKWYRDNNALFIWPKSRFADGYSFSIDRNPSGFPDAISDGLDSTVSFQNLENGIYYFHLRERGGGVWGGVSHYVIKIDNQPPAAFSVNISPSRRTKNKSPIFRFFTTDALSGLSHYEMKIIPLSAGNIYEALFFEVTSPYQAVNLEQGRYQIVIRAVDQAVNTRDEAVALNIVGVVTNFIDPDGIDLIFIFIPWSFIVSAAALLLFIMLLILLELWRKHQHHLPHAFLADVQNTLAFCKEKIRDLKARLKIFVIFLAILAVFNAPGVFAAAPTINIAPQIYYPLDELLYIEGRSAANAKIELMFEQISSSAQPVRQILNANSNGEWYFAQKLELSSGEWTVRTRSLDSASDWSNPRIIQSVVSGFVFGNIRVRYLPIAIALALLFLASVILLAYLLVKVFKFRRSMHFQQDIADELNHLGKAIKEGKKLSESEMRRRENLLTELRHAEEVISDKFKNVS